jgi:uncharacterized protein YegP (UPF0339 family)
MYFQILKASGGGYFFRIKAANHETLCHSEVYTTKAGALNAIAAIKSGAAGATTIDNS